VDITGNVTSSLLGVALASDQVASSKLHEIVSHAIQSTLTAEIDLSRLNYKMCHNIRFVLCLEDGVQLQMNWSELNLVWTVESSLQTVSGTDPPLVSTCDDCLVSESFYSETVLILR